MIQVRCPECGYLQSLSDEKYVSIKGDYLDCPHCSARVPKASGTEPGELVPEDVRHRMVAFSKRILSEGEITVEMIYALASLVRRHGPVQGSSKALGIGFFRLAEPEKAEEYLLLALEEHPNDSRVIRSLVEVLLAQEKFREAAIAAESLVNVVDPGEQTEAVALHALALIGSDQTQEAAEVLDSRHDLDQSNPFLKKARREIKRAGGQGFSSFLTELKPINRVLEFTGGQGLKRISDEARKLIRASAQKLTERAAPDQSGRDLSGELPAQEHTPPVQKRQTTLEYWIYSRNTSMPGLRDITERFSDGLAHGDERDLALRMLDSLFAGEDLKIDHVFKKDAPALFNYPDELIPSNSRELTGAETAVLKEAQMIVRVRAVTQEEAPGQQLPLITRLAEAVRSLTGGVVQDAISHILWGTDAWKRLLNTNQLKDPLESQIRFESLDEGQGVWIHSHGMQKFGLPEIEMEDIPSDLAAMGARMMRLVARTLLEHTADTIDVNRPMHIKYSPYAFLMELRPKDPEGHFPSGSCLILPYVSHYDPHSPDTIRHVLRMLGTRTRSRVDLGRKSEPAGEDNQYREPRRVGRRQKARFLEAHKKAAEDLSIFKDSFIHRTEPSHGDIHAVKVGFPIRENQYEWMWISLEGWTGHAIVGHLENTPVMRTDLSKGSTVHITEEEIFDWAILSRTGKVIKGAYTEEISARSGIHP